MDGDGQEGTVVFVMGVSGSGKSTIAARVADAFGGEFIEGDDLHPAANVAKMASGEPLSDADRMPWLESVASAAASAALRGGGGRAAVAGAVAVATCSALKSAYRRRLRDHVALRAGKKHTRVVFLFVQIARAVVAARLSRRVGHFMPAALLDSQFAALETPSPREEPDVLFLNVQGEESPEQLADEAISLVSAALQIPRKT
ncbi:hypothetical protein HK100_002546 [Physocladia obscura]|uniref:Gluconokinase n=1 Tax=Physocladia obscura TaxID=109957 RepID=A0AAD5XA60_9FUNG|nr:hypothetical protein HK100_002546 [Physocladia obscura]